MKINLKVINAFFVTIICFAMCFVSGCSNVAKKDMASIVDDISSVETIVIENQESAVNSSSIEETNTPSDENNTSVQEDNNISGNESTEQKNETTTESKNENETEIVESEEDKTTESKVESTVNDDKVSSTVVSKPKDEIKYNVKDESKDTSSDKDVTSEKEPTSKDETPKYPTITLFKKTTYHGFVGYFTNDQIRQNADLPSYGIAENNDNRALYCTEYYDVDTGDVIWFACDGNDVQAVDIMGYVDEVGRAEIPAKVKG